MDDNDCDDDDDNCTPNYQTDFLPELLREKDLMVCEAPSAEMLTFPPQAAGESLA